MNYSEAFVQREQYRVYAREYAGDEPVVILLHGFPDNLHLYDRLIPFLCPPRHVVAFDFLGWGESEKPSGYAYTSMNQLGDLNAVIVPISCLFRRVEPRSKVKGLQHAPFAWPYGPTAPKRIPRRSIG